MVQVTRLADGPPPDPTPQLGWIDGHLLSSLRIVWDRGKNLVHYHIKHDTKLSECEYVGGFPRRTATKSRAGCPAAMVAGVWWAVVFRSSTPLFGDQQNTRNS